ncbi:MAG: BlaI/MecI/CopY family transcriptional regulator [Bacteroidales bacterium]|jgi:predicted transcriptional regulator|nr:BlaI/MecI/CopY family transcriptional regulator [Bacteroidales bacterium]OQB59416.1 MAG: Penicillinase repressor [Bacteroidetes bacterium ADurb.Bin145]HOU03476.1 BlaI/MecI/CopY family transcriptional regulator [Bacteroidales bacterium]
MKEITKAQEEVLKVIWEIGNGAVADVLDNFPEPKPAYNTIATVIKVLEGKGYVGHRTYGKTHVYYPLVSREEYANHVVKEAFTGLFNGSLHQMVSPFIKNRSISINELEELRQMVESEIEKKRK